MSSSEHMKMKMEDGLSCIPTGIRNQSIARFPHSLQSGDLCTADQQSGK